MDDVPAGRQTVWRRLFDRLPSAARLPALRLGLAWTSWRGKRGRRIDVEPFGDHFVVDDGLRRIHVPDLERAMRFRRGIVVRLDDVAGKYGGHDGLRLSEGAVVVDVGANIGEFALWCADAGARVVAFEPDPRAFACLEENLATARHAEAVPYAVWHRQQTVPLHCAADTLSSALFQRPANGAHTVTVEAWSLDAAAAVATLPRIDLLKIDGEGAEPEILAGAARILRNVRLVVADVGEGHERANLRYRVVACLEEQGFELLPDSPAGLVAALNPQVDSVCVQYPRFRSIVL